MISSTEILITANTLFRIAWHKYDAARMEFMHVNHSKNDDIKLGTT
jgi:hypothetical protein